MSDTPELRIGIDNGILLHAPKVASSLVSEKRSVRDKRLREKDILVQFVSQTVQRHGQTGKRSKTHKEKILFAGLLLCYYARNIQREFSGWKQLQRLWNAFAGSSASLLFRRLLGCIKATTKTSWSCAREAHTQHAEIGYKVSEDWSKSWAPLDIFNWIQPRCVTVALGVIVSVWNVMGKLRQVLAYRPRQACRLFSLHKTGRFRFQIMLELGQLATLDRCREYQERFYL